MPVYLTKQDIIDSTGEERLEGLKDLEILFLTFEEVASLQYCPSLVRLSLIDNGLTRISNLQPISTTLKILCLCDQKITQMENLELPNLRELYLHRNHITCISNLQYCTKLKKLWVSQNQVTSLVGLLSITNLEELWVQSNQLSTLAGIENLINLKSLQLAGNPIKDITEILRIARYCPNLRDLCLFDIHFGICPIIEEKGMKEYILQQFPTLVYIDGVKVSPQMITQAKDIQEQFYQSYEYERTQILESCHLQLRDIEMQHQSKESYTQLLEKEMSAALKELFGLVEEGRSVITKEVQKSEELIQSNFASLTIQLNKLEGTVQETIQQELYTLSDQYTVTNMILQLFEGVERLYHEIVEVFATTLATTSSPTSSTSSKLLAYQIINPNAPEFLMLSYQIDPTLHAALLAATTTTNNNTNSNGEEEPSSTSQKLIMNTPRNRKATNTVATTATANTPSKLSLQTPNNNATTSSSNKEAKVVLDDENALKLPPMKVIELARLFKVVQAIPLSSSATGGGIGGNRQRMYTIMSLKELQTYCLIGWKGFVDKLYTIQGNTTTSNSGNSSSNTEANGNPKYAQLFSNDASVLTYLYEDSGLFQQFQTSSSSIANHKNTNHHNNTEDALESIMHNIIKYAHSNNNNSNNSHNNSNGPNSARKTPRNNNNNNNVAGAAVLPSAVEIIGKHFVLVSFQMILPVLNSNNKIPSVALPYYPHQKTELLSDLLTNKSSSEATSVRMYTIRHRTLPVLSPNSSSSSNNTVQSVLYTIPYSQCDTSSSNSNKNTIQTEIEFVCQCIQHVPTALLELPAGQTNINTTPRIGATNNTALYYPYPDTTTTSTMTTTMIKKMPLLKGLEARLEMLLYPTNNLSSSSHLLVQYEQQVQSEVKRYMDKLLVEVNEVEAMMLENTEKEINSRDAQMRRLREDIEKERRTQEYQLRELRSIATNENPAATNGGNGTNASGNNGMLSKVGSSKNIRR